MRPLPDLAMGPDNEVKKGYARLKVDTKAVNMDGWKCLETLAEPEPPAVLEMDFPDYGVPRDCQSDFWAALAIDIREQDVKRIHVMCMGGHGRTGIQLACLRWFLATEKERMEWPDAYTLVMEIREPYCDNAVEADSQQDYVAAMCGIPRGEALSFHKGQVYTHTSKNQQKADVELNNHNRLCLECSDCDFIAWEDDGVELLLEDSDCIDKDCKGHLTDVTDDAIRRNSVQDAKVGEYAINLTTLDVCSAANVFNMGILSEELMVRLHGKEWQKKINLLMNVHKMENLCGVLLRNLNTLLGKGDLDDDILVVTDDVLSASEVIGDAEVPSKRIWTKCGLCEKSCSPDRLAVAWKHTAGSNEAIPCCPNCMTKSGLEFYDRTAWHYEGDEPVFTSVVLREANGNRGDKVYKIEKGVSPIAAYGVRAMRNTLATKNEAALKDMIETKDEKEPRRTSEIKVVEDFDDYGGEDDWPFI